MLTFPCKHRHGPNARTYFRRYVQQIRVDLAAIETADVALMTDDISKLPWLVRHAKRTLAIIRQNIAFSLGVKALFVVLTFAGVASVWGAIAADVGALLLVVANALRLPRPTSASPAASERFDRPVEAMAVGRMTHGH